MKKATHIVALPVLTALLAACAAPVEQGRIDRIEGAATALADQTLVAGLEDDFAEIEKQWKEAERLGLVAGLEDDFAEVERQVSEIGKETDLAAKLRFADGLKKELETLANVLATRLDAANRLDAAKTAPSEGDVVYRELTYEFLNLDAVKLAKPNREKYVDDLEVKFRARRDDKGRLLPYKLESIQYLDKRSPEDPGTWLPDRNSIVGELAGVQFRLSNLEKGIDEITQGRIEGFVKEVTDNNVAGLVRGTPVVGTYNPPKPVTFKTLVVNYSSASGTGKMKYLRVCDNVKVKYSLAGIVKQRDATPYIYERVAPKEWKLTEWKSDNEKKYLAFPPIREEVKEDEACRWEENEEIVYIMVLLEGDELLPYVAEYHTITARSPATTDIPPKPKPNHVVWPGRLTKGIPACPPPPPLPVLPEWPDWQEDARNAFIDKLRDRVGGRGCTEEDYE